MAECESNPFSNAGIEFWDARSRGQYFSYGRDQTRTVSFPHPQGKCTTCYDESGLRMECGHYICPDDLLDWTWQQLSNMKYEIGCADCDKPIKQDDIINFGLPTLEEKQFLITAITTNFCENKDIQQCPQCQTLCQRTNTDNPQVHCTVCAKKSGKIYMFCWYCLHEWNNPSNYQVCGNEKCRKEQIEELMNSPKKKFKDRNGKILNIPTIRACPKCQRILEHSGGCNTFTCPAVTCKHKFCFICLSDKTGVSTFCNTISYDQAIGIKCIPAPLQTKLK